ncbi:DUF5908 family protein [Sphingomonas sp. 28-63-12]|uniref:DUF5908 family protein n=1 Tax=Sphingomonas sp. 28-63-12 TaxID=1970434 RepID=UPI000BCAF07A|nr:MAG: hypothetical protein B7Y47_05870 [Sphingomonas sp. 28-63-12]
MPLEISEIGVHLAVGDSAGSSNAALALASHDAGHGDDMISQAKTDAIIKACVEEVLRTLRAIEDR